MNHASLPSTTDILVAGGGPAGATIARLLAGFGFQVVLLEKRRFPRHQIGESLTPQIFPILDFLGVRAQVEAAGFLRMIGHTVCWGSAQPRTAYYSPDHNRHGFQVWREDFDSLLLRHARTGGVEVIEDLGIESVTLGGAAIVVHTGSGSCTTSFFIDASGHSGILARQGFRQRDATFQTLAVTGYWRDASNPSGIDAANTILETYPHGLVWSVPLHNGLRNVTLLTDWHLGKRIRAAGLASFYHSELRQVSYITRFLANARLAQPLQVFDATWYTSATFAGEQFLLVGDAGLFVDPLSSEGVHKAMASAITGAIVVHTILKRPAAAPAAIQFYQENQRHTYDSHYAESVRYYGEERRWPEAPFWVKRTREQFGVRSSEFGVSNPQSAIRDPQSAILPMRRPTTVGAVRIAADVRIELRPVIEGPFVEVREVVVAPPYPRGVRFLHEVCVPVLLHQVETRPAVADIMTAYLTTPEGRRCRPESVRQVLARLYRENVLVADAAAFTPTAPGETQSD
jgi:flavin-dependent dehydrogenase